jgi:hypothetical protein
MLSDRGEKPLALTDAQESGQESNQPHFTFLFELDIVVITLGRECLAFLLDFIQEIVTVVIWAVLVTHLRFLLLVFCVLIQLNGLSLIWLAEHRVDC